MNLSDQWNVFMDARKSSPVPVDEIPGKLGIGFKEAFLPDGISGMLERSEFRFAITINAPDSMTRRQSRKARWRPSVFE